MSDEAIKVGDSVVTKHGETIVVLEIKVEKTGTRYLAESGGTKCWFPAANIKSVAARAEAQAPAAEAEKGE